MYEHKGGLGGVSRHAAGRETVPAVEDGGNLSSKHRIGTPPTIVYLNSKHCHASIKGKKMSFFPFRIVCALR